MKFLVMFGVIHLLSLSSGKAIYKNGISQRTFQEMQKEVASYEDVAKAIINLAVYGKHQNRSYERLALLVDTVGPRLSGSKNLEKAIQIMYQNLQQDGLENVHLEPVKIPHWERGEESAVMLLPRIHKMAILGLGSSVGTPSGGITAEVLVVTSFDELQRRASEAKGKIVVYNQPYTSYGITVQYRTQGAVEAAKVGAVASLIRSVAPFSIYRLYWSVDIWTAGMLGRAPWTMVVEPSYHGKHSHLLKILGCVQREHYAWCSGQLKNKVELVLPSIMSNIRSMFLTTVW
ncbi:Carboxypeptidase Q [Lemmus lemmus]